MCTPSCVSKTATAMSTIRSDSQPGRQNADSAIGYRENRYPPVSFTDIRSYQGFGKTPNPFMNKGTAKHRTLNLLRKEDLK